MKSLNKQTLPFAICDIYIYIYIFFFSEGNLLEFHFTSLQLMLSAVLRLLILPHSAVYILISNIGTSSYSTLEKGTQLHGIAGTGYFFPTIY